MAQSGYTPISLYHSTTPSAAPTAGNLVDGELAINIKDGKLYYKDDAGAVQLLASKATATGPAGSNTEVQFNDNGNFGADSTFTWDGNILSVTSTGAITTPNGTTAQRPTPANGMLRYNTDEDSFEGYINGAWGGISGAQANGCIYENNVDITANYTLTTGKNGFSVGPITVASGVSVTVPSGQRWVVL